MRPGPLSPYAAPVSPLVDAAAWRRAEELRALGHLRALGMGLAVGAGLAGMACLGGLLMTLSDMRRGKFDSDPVLVMLLYGGLSAVLLLSRHRLLSQHRQAGAWLLRSLLASLVMSLPLVVGAMGVLLFGAYGLWVWRGQAGLRMRGLLGAAEARPIAIAEAPWPYGGLLMLCASLAALTLPPLLMALFVMVSTYGWE